MTRTNLLQKQKILRKIQNLEIFVWTKIYMIEILERCTTNTESDVISMAINEKIELFTCRIRNRFIHYSSS